MSINVHMFLTSLPSGFHRTGSWHECRCLFYWSVQTVKAGPKHATNRQSGLAWWSELDCYYDSYWGDQDFYTNERIVTILCRLLSSEAVTMFPTRGDMCYEDVWHEDVGIYEDVWHEDVGKKQHYIKLSKSHEDFEVEWDVSHQTMTKSKGQSWTHNITWSPGRSGRRYDFENDALKFDAEILCLTPFASS